MRGIKRLLVVAVVVVGVIGELFLFYFVLVWNIIDENT